MPWTANQSSTASSWHKQSNALINRPLQFSWVKVCTVKFGKKTSHACAETFWAYYPFTSCKGNRSSIMVSSDSRGQRAGEEASLLSHSVPSNGSGRISKNNLFSSLWFTCLLSNSTEVSVSWHINHDRDSFISWGIKHRKFRVIASSHLILTWC